MANPFVHVELATTDINKAKGFYGKLFDWKLEDMPMSDGMIYTMVGVGDGVGGGMIEPMRTRWSRWLDVAERETGRISEESSYRAGREAAMNRPTSTERAEPREGATSQASRRGMGDEPPAP